MANELSTAGILVKYCSETTAGTRPTTGYTTIPNITEISSLNPEPNTLEVTDLSDTVWKRYIAGLKDVGGAVTLTANFTTAFKTAWANLVTAYGTAASANPAKAVWFEIYVPNFASFYFAGKPSELGFDGASVDSVLQGGVYITPNQIHGWDTSSTAGL